MKTPFGAFDNHARAYRHIEARPIASSMGAEIIGADLAALPDEALGELLDALYRHKMVFLRGQKLDHAAHHALSARIGPFGTDAFTGGVPGFPDVQPVIKEAEVSAHRVFGGAWHTDSAFLERPPSVSTLRSVEVPPFGGDTFFANAVLAYEMLSPAMQRMIAPLRVHMSMQRNVAAAPARFTSPEVGAQAVEGCMHPMVRTHPVTGEKSLFVCQSRSIGIEGMTEAESTAILEFLVEHMTQPALTCRLRWEADMFVLWDNRICIHQACNDYDGYRREMYRTTVMGEVPA
jgi:taurine dioxygenase